MHGQRGLSSPRQTLSRVGTWVSRRWGRALWSLVFTVAIGSSPALAQDTYFLYLDQTGAQTQVDVEHFSSWHIIVKDGASFALGGGNFAMKKGNNTTADAVLTLYEGPNTSGTVLGSKTLTVAAFTGQFNPVPFNFGSVQTLTSGRYYVTLTSTAPDVQGQAYFVKGVQNVIISTDGTTSISDLIATISSSPGAANLSLTKTATATVATSGTITYTLSLGNDGGSPSGTSATVKDQLPTGATATAATAVSGVSSLNCTNLNTAGAELTCTVTLTSALASGASSQAAGAPKFTITATAPSSAGSITNFASVDATGGANPATPNSSCTTTSCSSAATTVTSAGFTVTESGGTSVSETGTTDTFTLVLDAQPTTNVVLTVVSGDTDEATLSPASLTFTNANWNSAQTVTVTGVDDVLVDGTQTTTVTVSVDDANSDDTFDPLADQTVSVSTTDDDSAGFTVTESGGTSVSETGTTDTFTLVLDAQPTTNVVLTVVSGDTDEATLSPASLTFTNANWNTAQTVTVTGVDDVLVDGTQTTTVTVSVDDANSDDTFDPLADQTVSVSTTDDDSAGFTVTESGGTSVSETGTTDTFTLVLDAEPSSNVVLTVVSGDTDEATLSPASLTFTNANWNTAQTVTVTGVDDVLVDGTQTTTVTVSVDDASSNDTFDPLADQTVSVSTADDDSPGFTAAESGGSTSVSETGTTDTVTLVLDAQPTTDVVLTVASGDTGEATLSPTSVTFTNANWNTAQTVTVTGVDDALIDGTQTTTVTVSVDDASSDDAFDPLADQTVSVSTADDDSAGFTVAESGGSTLVSETGTTDTFTLVLDAQPTTNVVLTVVSGDTDEATFSPASLTFTNANWNTAQTVTVTGVDDALIDGTQTTTLTVSVDDQQR